MHACMPRQMKNSVPKGIKSTFLILENTHFFLKVCRVHEIMEQPNNKSGSRILILILILILIFFFFFFWGGGGGGTTDYVRASTKSRLLRSAKFIMAGVHGPCKLSSGFLMLSEPLFLIAL